MIDAATRLPDFTVVSDAVVGIRVFILRVAHLNKAGKTRAVPELKKFWKVKCSSVCELVMERRSAFESGPGATW